MMKHNWQERFFVVYKGEEIICNGTIYEISERLGLKIDYCKFLCSNSYFERERKHYQNRVQQGGGRLILVEG